jgi:hypothetical protein
LPLRGSACPRGGSRTERTASKTSCAVELCRRTRLPVKNGPDRPLELDLKTPSRSDYADSDIRRLDPPFRSGRTHTVHAKTCEMHSREIRGLTWLVVSRIFRTFSLAERHPALAHTVMDTFHLLVLEQLDIEISLRRPRRAGDMARLAAARCPPINAALGLVSCPMQNAPILLAETALTFFVLPPVQLCAS